jgi:hypothetical protein
VSAWLCPLAGLALTGGGWALARSVAGAGWRSPRWWPLDALPGLLVFAVFLSLSGRCLLAGVIGFALGAGYAYADRAKRRVLAEPVVFTDVFQAFDILRHPRLALPFPHKGRVLACVLAAGAFFSLLFRMEAPLPGWHLWWLPVVLGLLVLGMRGAAGRFNAPIARRLESLGGHADPRFDSALVGPFATLLAHGILARAQRARRQAAAAVTPATPPQAPRSIHAAPLVVVQCESFFDARRLHPALQALPLPALDRCRDSSRHWGRLGVPSWGANTVRTEFSVLTGMAPEALGYDRFNPYHAFARAPIASLAWRMRAEGHRCICLHPFDRTFYGRDVVLPQLGFEHFIGEEAFAGAQRVNGYVTDVEVAKVAAELLREERGRVFLFVITMENHGPWPAPPPKAMLTLPPTLAVPAAERRALESYLLSLQSADAMIELLMRELPAYGGSSMLAFYGDHLPSFPNTFTHLGLGDLRSDYALWRADGGAGQRLDLQAENLALAILAARGRGTRGQGVSDRQEAATLSGRRQF